jgi:hypothetical protein
MVTSRGDIMDISRSTEVLAGILLLSLVTVESGGAFLLKIAAGRHPVTPVQQKLFRAGHAHAGVLLVLALVLQLYVDVAALTGGLEAVARLAVPAAALLMPAGFFFSVLRPGAERPNRFILLTALGAVCLATGLAVLGVALLVP